MRDEDQKVGYLEHGGKVERADADERRRGSGDEDADLVEKIIKWVERSEVCERSGRQREEQGWCYTLVDGVFGDVYEEKREHVWEE